MAVAKEKTQPPAPSAELFGQLESLFSQETPVSTKSLLNMVHASMRRLKSRASPLELANFRRVVRELASEVDLLLPDADVTAADWDRAQKEDQSVATTLAGLPPKGSKRPMTTAASIAYGDQVLAQAAKTEAATTAELIEAGELISSVALQERLAVGKQAVSNAVKARRIFSFIGPSGHKYYPAFYASPDLDRDKVELVSKRLGDLPAASKYFFLTSESTWLGATPLEALRKGRVADVLAAAAGFAER